MLVSGPRATMVSASPCSRALATMASAAPARDGTGPRLAGKRGRPRRSHTRDSPARPSSPCTSRRGVQSTADGLRRTPHQPGRFIGVEQSEQAARVVGGRAKPGIAGDGGHELDAQLRRAQRQHDRERVVDARIGVDDDRARTRAFDHRGILHAFRTRPQAPVGRALRHGRPTGCRQADKPRARRR